jgi:hypothetical protein
MNSYSLRQYLEETSHPRSKKTANDSVGDAHLYFSNPIYRSVRDEILKLGFRITSEPSFDYFASPMLSLDRLLAEKELPCHRNLVPLKNLERSRPKHFAAFEVARFTNKNHVLHESGHAIAQDAWKRVFKSKGSRPSARKAFILRSLFGEACANSLDLTPWLYGWASADKISLRMNSYMEPNENQIRALQEVSAEIGSRALVEMIAALYLFSNFSVKPSVPGIRKTFALLFPESKLTPTVFKNVRLLAKRAMSLNPVFRTTTTEVYFRAVGFDGKIADFVSATEEEILAYIGQVRPALKIFSAAVIPQ